MHFLLVICYKKGVDKQSKPRGKNGWAQRIGKYGDEIDSSCRTVASLA